MDDAFKSLCHRHGRPCCWYREDELDRCIMPCCASEDRRLELFPDSSIQLSEKVSERSLHVVIRSWPGVIRRILVFFPVQVYREPFSNIYLRIREVFLAGFESPRGEPAAAIANDSGYLIAQRQSGGAICFPNPTGVHPLCLRRRQRYLAIAVSCKAVRSDR